MSWDDPETGGFVAPSFLDPQEPTAGGNDKVQWRMFSEGTFVYLYDEPTLELGIVRDREPGGVFVETFDDEWQPFVRRSRRRWRVRMAVASLTALLIFALCVYTIWRLYTVLLGAF